MLESFLYQEEVIKKADKGEQRGREGRVNNMAFMLIGTLKTEKSQQHIIDKQQRANDRSCVKRQLIKLTQKQRQQQIVDDNKP